MITSPSPLGALVKLMARIDITLRHRAAAVWSTNEYRSGDLRVDLVERRVFRNKYL